MTMVSMSLPMTLSMTMGVTMEIVLVTGQCLVTMSDVAHIPHTGGGHSTGPPSSVTNSAHAMSQTSSTLWLQLNFSKVDEQASHLMSL